MRTHEYRLPKANITPLGISLAPLAQISIYLNIPSSTVAATTVPLLHRARQSRAGEGWYGAEPTNDGQPFPQSPAKPSRRRSVWVWFADERRSTFPTKPGKAERAKVGVAGKKTDERRSARLLRHAFSVPPFPLSGKSTPQRLLRNRGKVDFGYLSLFNLRKYFV